MEAQDQFDVLLSEYTDAYQFSGTVLIAKGDTILYQKALGYADKEQKINNQLTTNFNIASMGKTFTATLIMQLVQEGKLKLDQTVHSILPAYRVKKADSITIRHLLTHTSGVGNYMMHPDFEKDRLQLNSLSKVMRYVTDQEPTMGYVGQAHHYSNSGFIILGCIIEKITGKSYAENLRERIFGPLGIQNSYIHYPATFVAPKEAVPYLSFTATSFVNNAENDFPAFSDGGLQSNVQDVYQFAKGLLHNKLLNEALRDSMWQGKVTIQGKRKYGYGWIDTENELGKHIYGHSGGGKGFSSDLAILKEEGYIVVVLANTRLSAREISTSILNVLTTGIYRKPEKRMETIWMETMEQKGFDSLLVVFSQFNEADRASGKISPRTFTNFIAMLEALKAYDKALIMCERAREQFPKDASLYSVTGQVYLTMKNYREAIVWFNKALEQNPNDEFAQTSLIAAQKAALK